MSSSYKKSKYKNYLSEDEITEALKAMQSDESYRTTAGYSSDIETYPDNKIPFVKSHLHYLKTHPMVNPEHYLGNLRIMLKVR